MILFDSRLDSGWQKNPAEAWISQEDARSFSGGRLWGDHGNVPGDCPFWTWDLNGICMGFEWDLGQLNGI